MVLHPSLGPFTPPRGGTSLGAPGCSGNASLVTSAKSQSPQFVQPGCRHDGRRVCSLAAPPPVTGSSNVYHGRGRLQAARLARHRVLSPCPALPEASAKQILSTYTSMYICMCVYVCTYVRRYVCMIHTHTHACMHACIHAYLHRCIEACIHTYIHSCVYYIYIYIYTHL